VADTITEPPPKKRSPWGWIIAIVIILLLIWAFVRYRNNSARMGTADTTSIRADSTAGVGAASSTTP
jgi:flagellar biogenesis protein FliO